MTDRELIDTLADKLETTPGLKALIVAALDCKDRTALNHATDFLKGRATADLTRDFYTIQQAADLLQVHPNTIYNLERRKEIAYYKIGNQIRIPVAEIAKLRQERETN